MGRTSLDERNYNIDLVKCTALFFVVCVHSFLGLKYYYMTLSFSAFSVIFTCLRQFFICCVPLFLLSTGYLCCEKQYRIDKEWIIKLSRIVFPFVLTTVILIVFYKLFDIEHNPLEMLLGIEKYSYAWYVEMYIGLYLLMPFINIVYSGIKTKRTKTFLIIILIFLTYVPSVLSLDSDFSVDYWKKLYPITLYFIGAYIKEFGISLSKIKLLIIMLVSLSYNTFIELMTSNGTTFCWNILSDYNSFPVLITSTCIFLFLMNSKINNPRQSIRKLLTAVSKATLPAYLISKLFDTVVYEFIIAKVSDEFAGIYFYMPITVVSVFLASVFTGILIQKLSDIITKKILDHKDKIVLKKV